MSLSGISLSNELLVHRRHHDVTERVQSNVHCKEIPIDSTAK